MKNIFKHIIKSNKKRAIQILDSCRIKDNQIEATNLAESVTVRVDGDGSEFLAPLKVVQRCMNNKKESICFRTNKIVVDGISVNTEPGSEDPEGFPETIDVDTILYSARENVSVAELQKTLEQLKKIASNDDMRPHINGISFRGDTAAATDGHRLHTLHTFSLPGTKEDPVFVSKVELETLIEVCKATDLFSVSFFSNEDRQLWNFGYITVHRKYAADSQDFPDVEKVMPTNKVKTLFTLDGAKLRTSLKIMGLDGASSDHCRVTVSEKGGPIYIENETGMIDGSCSKVEIGNSSSSSEGIIFGARGQYLIDATPATGSATVELSGSLDPILVTHGKFKNVVMPTRLSEE